MPHVLPFYTKAGKTAIIDTYGTLKKFDKHLVKAVLNTFNSTCDEIMDKDNVPLHPFTITTSMPIDIEPVIVAWDTPARHPHRRTLEHKLRLAVLPGNFPVPWQLNLVFAGDRRLG